MASFKSEPAVISAPAEKVYKKLSNLDNLASFLANVPSDRIPDTKQREMLQQIKIDHDSISVPGGPVGAVRMVVTERIPDTLVKLEGEGTPVAMSMLLHIDSKGTDTSEVWIEFDIQIPAMLAPMVKGPLQKMVDQFSTLVKLIPFND